MTSSAAVPVPPSALPGDELLDALLVGTPEEDSPVTHVHRLPVRESSHGTWPTWVPTDLRDRLAALPQEVS